MQIEVETSALQKAALARAKQDSALEAKACALVRKYGLFLPDPAKAFFRELAGHLNWKHLEGAL